MTRAPAVFRASANLSPKVAGDSRPFPECGPLFLSSGSRRLSGNFPQIIVSLCRLPRRWGGLQSAAGLQPGSERRPHRSFSCNHAPLDSFRFLDRRRQSAPGLGGELIFRRFLRVGVHPFRASSLLFLASFLLAQDFTQRGFLETTGLFFPQAAPNDSGHATGEALLRYEAFYKLTPDFHLAGGIDARTDTHLETERSFDLSWWDRSRQRPAFAVRRLSAIYTRGKLTVEAGKQFIRWGKTDILNPTDRFAPKDFLNVVDTDFLGITAGRVTYGDQANTIEVVAAPRLTPSRVPLLNQRWAVLPAGVPVSELPPDIPGGPQFGARWNHIGSAAEFSFSFYNGYDHLPLYRAQIDLAPVSVQLQRFYPQMRMYGADAAIPLSLVTLKAEAAYFTSSTPQSDQYALYVVQLERQAGEWSFAGGYAGQVITDHGTAVSYSPVRGLTRAIVARAGYTIDVNRSVAFETVIRQNGQGYYLKPEYTQAFGQHWRLTAGFALIRGADTDFLGQYHRNSHGILTLRYSF